MQRLPGSAQHAHAQNGAKSRSAGSMRSIPLQSRRSVGALIKRRDGATIVWPNPYGIIREAIRNNLVLVGSLRSSLHVCCPSR